MESKKGDAMMRNIISRVSVTILFSKYMSLLLLLGAVVLIHGCATVVDATTDEPIKTNVGERPFGTFINDENLEIFAKVNMDKAHPDFKKANVNINVFNGVALLTGQVATEELRRLAARTVGDLSQIRQVHNELQVQGNMSLLSQANDTWLANKVKTKLLANKDVEGSRVKVIAEDGTIYLMGLVSRTEAEKITRLVSATSAIKQVVRVFEYIDVK
jgi:osmotically-inducible protein OsmY